jgi:hypothetical protein
VVALDCLENVVVDWLNRGYGNLTYVLLDGGRLVLVLVIFFFLFLGNGFGFG